VIDKVSALSVQVLAGRFCHVNLIAFYLTFGHLGVLFFSSLPARPVDGLSSRRPNYQLLNQRKP
jgi:hypothetical protein